MAWRRWLGEEFREGLLASSKGSDVAMEATHTITISLVLPMVGQLLKATNPSSKVMLLDYGDDPSNATQIKMKVSLKSGFH